MPRVLNSLLERAGIDAAVDQEILAGDVARLDAAQIGAQLAELLGRAEAARGNRLLDVPPHLFHGPAFLLRGELGVALQPVGPEAPGEQVVDRDVVRGGRAREVMLTMRPKRLAIIPSTVALISSTGVSMFAVSAFCQSSSENLRKSPGGGPAALVTRMSGCGQAASAAMRPCSLVMSAATVTTVAPVAARISSAVFSSVWRSRATSVTRQPSRASDVAHPRPSPLLAPHTSAALPRIFRSTI